MAEHESAAQYMTHHLTHQQVVLGSLTWNVDTLLMSALLAALIAVLMFIAARGARSDRAPTGLTLFVEHVWGYSPFRASDLKDCLPPDAACLFRSPGKCNLTTRCRPKAAESA